MYQAKVDGKNNHVYFSEELKMQNTERHSIENELKVALKENQFELFYQPQTIANTGEICSVEALLRWNHPEKGLMKPEIFIPILEETGLIVDVGKWVLLKATAQLVSWKKSGLNMRMAVNVSEFQLRDSHLHDLISQLLKLHPIQSADLELELKESSVAKNTDACSEALTALSALGVGLSLDNFGTGYSSLGHLKKLPMNTVKIDRSFIAGLPQDEHDIAITTTIIAMARNLHLKVIAEGVETAEQSTLLNTYGCDFLQGSYISKPLPAESLERVLQENREHFSNNAIARIA